MPDKKSVQHAPKPHNDVGTKTGAAAPATCPTSPTRVADRPHWITILLGVFSPSIAIVALFVAWGSLRTSERSMKVSQRAYLGYEIAVTNGNQVAEALRADRDFFLYYQVTVTNMGNTPADSISPKLNVLPDPDRPPLMITFPTAAFDLGPKESRVLTGQALFKHMHSIRQLPGFSSGFTGQIEYKDVFGDRQVKEVCYQFLVSGDTPSAGKCGTIIQLWQIKQPG